MIIGDQGLGKTSLGFTFETPLHIDFDRGVQRSTGRKDTLQPVDWAEILELEKAGEFKPFKTIVIDTPKAALDDFLIPYVISVDSRLGSQKFMQQRFGQIGEQFKRFINNCRNANKVVVFICHAKKDEDGKVSADVTGQSLSLIMRIADQVGYVTIKNQKRVMLFDPTEFMALKNTANLQEMVIPHKDDATWLTFGTDLANKVREKIWGMSEEQREAVVKSQQYQDLINSCADIAELNGLADNIAELPPYLNTPLLQVLGQKYVSTMYAITDVAVFNVFYKEVSALPPFLMNGIKKLVSPFLIKMKWRANEKTKAFEEIDPSPSTLPDPATSTDPAEVSDQTDGKLFSDKEATKKGKGTKIPLNSQTND